MEIMCLEVTRLCRNHHPVIRVVEVLEILQLAIQHILQAGKVFWGLVPTLKYGDAVIVFG